MTNNREHERYTYFLDVALESSSGKLEAKISEIGVGGCYFDTIATLPAGEEVVFKFGPPFNETLQFTGTVAYVFPGMGFGVKFTNLTDEHHAVIEQIIRSRIS